MHIQNMEHETLFSKVCMLKLVRKQRTKVLPRDLVFPQRPIHAIED